MHRRRSRRRTVQRERALTAFGVGLRVQAPLAVAGVVRYRSGGVGSAPLGPAPATVAYCKALLLQHGKR